MNIVKNGGVVGRKCHLAVCDQSEGNLWKEKVRK